MPAPFIQLHIHSHSQHIQLTHKFSFLPQGAGPNERAAHATAVMGDNVYLFGGRHGSSRLNDLYSLNLSTHLWSGRWVENQRLKKRRQKNFETACYDPNGPVYLQVAVPARKLSGVCSSNTVRSTVLKFSADEKWSFTENSKQSKIPESRKGTIWAFGDPTELNRLL